MNTKNGILVAVLVILILPPASGAALRLPHVIGSHMVLQADADLPVWGWAEPGDKVIVQLGEVSESAKAGESGLWRVELPPQQPGGPPLELRVTCGEEEIVLEDILIGEVWLCSGQSNMEWQLRMVEYAVEEVNAANYPDIRLFQVPRVNSHEPKQDVEASWQRCETATANNFSAVAYFFGRALHREIGVPVGLIQSAWGGTRIEPWTPPGGFAGVPELAEISDEIAGADAVYQKALDSSLVEIESWLGRARAAVESDSAVPDMPELAVHPLQGHQRPTSLYNGMIHPLVPYALRGFIWYQGESNLNEGESGIYFHKMRALIEGWRKVWNNEDLSFYYVQLAPYGYDFLSSRDRDVVHALPKMWDTQRKALEIPNTGMAVTTDISYLLDIHPRNKQEVGRRLALWALNRNYGWTDLIPSGPLYRSKEVMGGRIVIRFDYTNGGLASADGRPLEWFEIAADDGKFVRARAVIKGDVVEVWSPEIEAPVMVRFGWDEAAVPNLINRDGLPASPFHSGR